MKFVFYSDPAHGWIKVKKSLLSKLGITDKISAYSYMHKDFAYLEEDQDYTAFKSAMSANGLSVEYKDQITISKRSKIRSYQSYQA